MEQGSVFWSENGQVVSLPDAVALPEGVKQVDVIAVGRSRIITPVEMSWDGWFSSVGVTTDFMMKRD
jgi:antitoxin VapB